MEKFLGSAGGHLVLALVGAFLTWAEGAVPAQYQGLVIAAAGVLTGAAARYAPAASASK
jgi:hypothetical protein